MKLRLQNLQLEVLRILRLEDTSYAKPLNSNEIGKKLNTAPCYIRRQLSAMVTGELVGVRRGSGGGYYINSWRSDMQKLDAGQSKLKYFQDLKVALVDMAEYFSSLLKGLSQIAMTMQTGQGENAHKLLDQALEGIDWYLKLLSAAQSILGIDYNESEADNGQKIAEIIERLKKVLAILFETYRSGDTTLTADIIEYELVPVIEAGYTVISALIGFVDGKLTAGEQNE